MQGFDEAWLAEYQAKLKPALRPVEAGPIQFTLKEPFRLLNVLLRMHWRARANYNRKIAAEAGKLTAHRLGAPPLERARVLIERYSVQEPDQDGLVGGAKPVIDALLVRSSKHPHGLGFIVDDSPTHLTLDVRHVKALTLKGQGTLVRIEPGA